MEPKRKKPLEDAVDLFDRLGDLVAKSGDGALVYLYRIEPKTRFVREDAFLEKFDEMPEVETVREVYGGGTFRVRVRIGGKWAGEGRFSIEGPPRFAEDEEMTEAEATPLSDEDKDRIEFHKTLRQVMIARELKQTLEPPDPFKMLQTAIELVESRREPDPPPSLFGGDAAPYLPLLERALELLAPTPGAKPKPAALPPRTRNPMFSQLAHAIEHNTPPADVVDRALQLLPPVMVSKFVAMSANDWTAFLRGTGVRRFQDPAAVEYLEAIHAELSGRFVPKTAKRRKPAPAETQESP